MASHRRVALVLGGGGFRGFAHIGVLRALAERNIEPVLVAGTSIGSLIGAAYASGMPLEDMEQRAHAFRRRELFRINHLGMVLERMNNPSIYLEQPLRNIISSIVPDVTLDELPRRLLITTVDVARGTQVVWGLPGLRDVNVADAVYASCALPGFFPPGQVDGRICVDGGVMENLPIMIGGLGVDAVIAVDVGAVPIRMEGDLPRQGFAATFMRSATIMMREMQTRRLSAWQGPPMLLIQPPVSHIDAFSTSHTPQLIEAGYAAAIDGLRDYQLSIESATGIFPRKQYRIVVDETKCIACGLCAALAPDIMGLNRVAFPRQEIVSWSPADGDFVRQCPTDAISVHVV